jgi:nucleoside-diphosphate-sugar epimerase
MTKVIVTGAAGFLGRHVLTALQDRGYEVHAFTRATAPAGVPGQVRWHRVDLLDRAVSRAAFEQVRAEGLIHLAWETAHGRYWTSPENLDWTAASLHLLQDFRECGGRRVVIAGSSAEYDWSAPSPLDEQSTPLLPASLYGHCRNALREIVEAWAPSSGVSWAWGRIFNLYGPFEKPDRLVPRVIRVLEEGRTLAFDDGSLVRDFLYVADASDAFAALYSSCVEGAVNIASGTPAAVREVVAGLAASLGRSQQVDFGALPIPEDAPKRLVASVERLHREVGWSASRTLGDGLRETCNWWRSGSARVAQC